MLYYKLFTFDKQTISQLQTEIICLQTHN